MLARTGVVLARSALITPALRDGLPPPARAALKLARLGYTPSKDAQGLSETLQRLGPSHIKLGQFLATRPDVIGVELADQLSKLQDRLPPFALDDARAQLTESFASSTGDLFGKLDAPVAAASIAQVHKLRVAGEEGRPRDIAVKILRPGIERRLARDLEAFRFAAAMIERLSAPARRLRPKAAVETLARSVAIELDLRLEAAALSEMARNIEHDPGFRLPEIDWGRTAKRVLTTSWVDGIPVSNIKALKKAGHDLPELAANVIRSFLRHAMRDGFFHADMHPGNLFVDEDGGLVAVDLGIMGRLAPKDRLFLAEILHGFITRDYARVARVHFDAGYVPAQQSPELFAQALRAIGEPIMDRPADEISMAKLLAQLFEVTGQFDMETQPQLLLLQKTMVVVEGVARMLDPQVNMWEVAEPEVAAWMRSRLGPEGRLQDAADGMATIGRLMADLPGAAQRFERVASALEKTALDPDFPNNGQPARPWQAVAAWISAAALCVIALALIF